VVPITKRSPWIFAGGSALAVAAVVSVIVAASDGGLTDNEALTSTTAFQTPVGTVGAPVGTDVVGTGTSVPSDFPTEVPVPHAKLVGGEANTGGEAKKYQLYFTGDNLQELIAGAKKQYADEGFAISGEYDGTVRGTESAGFVGTSGDWTVTVAGTQSATGAAMSVTVLSI
jgi:hypothetical protein